MILPFTARTGKYKFDQGVKLSTVLLTVVESQFLLKKNGISTSTNYRDQWLGMSYYTGLIIDCDTCIVGQCGHVCITETGNMFQ